jgi:cbb3-type cytochrome oxidase maturation protein
MSVIYIVLPLALLFAIVAVIVFIRAVRAGQFDDLDTPAVRALHDDRDAKNDTAPAEDAATNGNGEENQ